MRLAPHSVVVGLAVVALGCSGSPADTTTIVRPELVRVSPADFLGEQTCQQSKTDVQSYVATLFDVTPLANGVVPDPGFQLPSSAATPCTKPVTFSKVVAGHVYLAEIDAYDRGYLDLTATTPGSRIQLRAGSDDRVSPRWKAKCGGYAESIVADGGTYVTYGGGPSSSAGAAGTGAGGVDGVGGLNGIVSYDTLTQTPHDCGVGLR